MDPQTVNGDSIQHFVDIVKVIPGYDKKALNMVEEALAVHQKLALESQMTRFRKTLCVSSTSECAENQPEDCADMKSSSKDEDTSACAEKPAEKTDEKQHKSWANASDEDTSDEDTSDEDASDEDEEDSQGEEKEETADEPAAKLSLKDLLNKIEEILSNCASGEMLLAQLGTTLGNSFDRNLGKLSEILGKNNADRFSVANQGTNKASVMLASAAATATKDAPRNEGNQEGNPPTTFATIVKNASSAPPTVKKSKVKEETPSSLTVEERFRQEVRKVLARLNEASGITDCRIVALLHNTLRHYEETKHNWHSKVCRYAKKCRDRDNCPHLHNEAEDVAARVLIRWYSGNPMFAKELCPKKPCKDSVNCQFRHPELGDETPPPRAKKL